MKTIYFYTKNTTSKQSTNGFSEKFYQLIAVPLSKKKSIDEADRKARTIAEKLGTKLAGGYFNDNCKPYKFEENYTVINCPINTKIQPYTEKDLFIINLIEKGQ